MSFDTNNKINPSNTEEHLENSKSNHLTLVSDNSQRQEHYYADELKSYLKLVEDSVNILFLTAILEAKVKKNTSE